MNDPRCAHCMRPVLDYAIRMRERDRQLLCHPDFGLDCYSLVTLAGHATPCEYCRLIRDEQDAGRRANAFVHEMEQR
jgi:hypothetical protein